MRTMIRTLALAGLWLLATTVASAHDPGQFDQMLPMPAALPVPTTCDELADTDNYSSDESNARIKVLKQRCDERKATPSDRTPAKAAESNEPASEEHK